MNQNYLTKKVKKNRRFKVNRDYIFISRSAYLGNSFKYKKYNKHLILVHRNELKHITFKRDKQGIFKKDKDLKWLFNQKNFYFHLKIKPSFNQLRELKKILYNMNNYSEYFILRNIAFFINGGVERNFIERHRLLINLKSQDKLFAQILRYGIKEGKKIKNTGWGKGEKNPAYKHGGKLSPWSKKFIKYNGLTENEKEKRSNKSKEKCIKNRINNTSLEYYIKQGYDEDTAKKLQIERQRTFSLNKLIEKYGIDGYIKWYNRQKKWQKTLNSKSDLELEEINVKKGKGGIGKWVNGLFILSDFYKNKNGILYYFTFFENNKQYWKIGISTKKFEQRFSTKIREKYKIKLIEITNDTIENCFLTEQMILKVYDNKRIRTSLSTECFMEDILCKKI